MSIHTVTFCFRCDSAVFSVLDDNDNDDDDVHYLVINYCLKL